MNSADFPVLDFSRPRVLSPTDIGGFGRLEGCERFLRLRLHTTNVNAKWLEQAGLSRQAIPALLTSSGADFERQVEAALGLEPSDAAATGADGSGASLENANARLLASARNVAAGQCVMKTQVTLGAELDGWQMRGVIDLLRLSRDSEGGLHVLIADMKASQRAKVEHRLQLAFYYRMIAALFASAGEPIASLKFGVLYKGPGDRDGLTPDQVELLEKHRAAAREIWGLDEWFFESCDDEATYLNSLRRLVFDEDSQARTIAAKDFSAIEYHLTKKCDTCVFAEFCLKSSAQSQDLSLLPYLTSVEKGALKAGGIVDIPDLAALKAPRATPADKDDPRGWNELQTAAGQELRVAKLAGDRQVGARLDELIHRAHAFLRTPGFKGYIPSRGEGTLPFVTPEINANIVRIYLDAGLDFVNDRAYYLGARFVAYRDGEPVSERNLVQIASAPPDSARIERELIRQFFGEAQAIAAEMANAAEYIDEDGVIEFAAPIHVTFFDRMTQQIWLDALGRHFETLIACAPVFDFLKQLPSGDSFVVSTLDSEARQLKNYPLLSPSLQILARYLKFSWGEAMAKFRRGLFDDGSTLDDETTWFTARSRFTSQIPLEYAYGAWGTLPAPHGRDEPYRGFRDATLADLRAFCEQRLEAIAHIAGKFRGNTKTTIRPYELDELLDFKVKEPTFVDALQTFLQMERLAELGAWKAARHAPPERRMLSGDSLVVRYREDDQSEQVRAQNALNRELLKKRADYKEEHRKTSDKRVKYPDEMSSKLIDFEIAVKLRIETTGCDCSLHDALGQSSFRAGDFVWLHERQTFDSRVPEAERIFFHPTVRQLLIFSKNAKITRNPWIENGAGWIEVQPDSQMGGDGHNFTFGGDNCAFGDGETYSLDPNPNDWSGSSCFKQHEKIAQGEPNFVHDLLSGKLPQPDWPNVAAVGQARFLAGLKALGTDVFVFEQSKEAYIGAHGGAPLLLVQGPPGTGKTYATAFALLARLQGAMAAGLPWRGLISAHTHSAVNVALQDVHGAQQKLRAVQSEQPELFARFFDARLLDVPLFRLQGTSTDFAAYPYLVPLWFEKKEADKYQSAWIAPREALLGRDYCLAGAVPMGARKIWNADKKQETRYFNALVVDEASQMNQPLACLAAVAHRGDSSLIVVGDPRQMPPITRHQWENESHRVFEGQAAFESLYAAIEAREPVKIAFAESFRLHARMAQFLREAIYAQDGIDYHSNKVKVLPQGNHADPFSAAVLAPDHPIVLIVHDEAASILENAEENNVLRPILEQLTSADLYALDAKDGLGIVVPHRAQRALLGDERWKVDTVERFQGDQRRVMAFSATESDPLYLLHNGGFLLDPRRLCVSLSRAKEKLILVAAKSVFDLVPLDEATFLNAQLWQKLRHEFCTHELWQGEIGGAKVKVLGSGLG